jgi:TatA/E family protein of Tat protein translocase
MGLGVSEVILILVIGLIVFGPRKLPELGKSLGQAMSQFRKASDEFKRTWSKKSNWKPCVRAVPHPVATTTATITRIGRLWL